MTTTTARHLLALDGMSRDELLGLLDRAQEFRPIVDGDAPPRTSLAGRIVANLFLESSTRTRGSFTVAAQRLGADTVDLGADSSLTKGETILDTAYTVEAMGVSALVIRAAQSGVPAMVARQVGCAVINAGDGTHEHPTQGLLDALTLRQRLGDLEGRRIAIVGDIGNSRVARSNVWGLTTLGADVLLIGPPAMVPPEFATFSGGISIGHELDPILPEIDAIIMLRVQFERGSSIGGDYRDHFALTEARAERLRPEAPVMHPGPMNRGLEIDGPVADDSARSVIREQVTNGVAVRMAVLEEVLGSGR
jgi:aspartate carbamoyltransferase catalytic subunit